MSQKDPKTYAIIGPQGRPIQRYSYADSADLKRRLRQILHQLIVEQEVPAWDIVLLTPKGRERSELWRFGTLGNFRLTDQPSEASGEIYCTTIHSFKGLESPIVILAELDNDQLWQLPTLLYIGCSRARNHLILLHAHDLSATIESQLEGGPS